MTTETVTQSNGDKKSGRGLFKRKKKSKVSASGASAATPPKDKETSSPGSQPVISDTQPEKAQPESPLDDPYATESGEKDTETGERTAAVSDDDKLKAPATPERRDVMYSSRRESAKFKELKRQFDQAPSVPKILDSPTSSREKSKAEPGEIDDEHIKKVSDLVSGLLHLSEEAHEKNEKIKVRCSLANDFKAQDEKRADMAKTLSQQRPTAKENKDAPQIESPHWL